MKGWLEVLQSNEHPKERKASSRMRQGSVFSTENHTEPIQLSRSTQKEKFYEQEVSVREDSNLTHLLSDTFAMFSLKATTVTKPKPCC